MIDRLAAELAKSDVTACDRQRLYSHLAFFRTYPPLWLRLESDGAAIVRSMTGQLAVMGRMLLVRLSYTHLELLTAIDNPLKRQSATLYFERSGLSTNKEKVAAPVKRFRVEGETGHDRPFWGLAQASSALYPKRSEEERCVDGVLARKKGLGF